MKKLFLLGAVIGAMFVGYTSHAYTPESCFTIWNIGTTTAVGIDGYTCADTILDVPPTIGGKTVEEIGTNAFKEKGLTSVTLPSTVKIIYNNAFDSNPITFLDLGTGIQTIQQYAFYSGLIENLVLPNSLTILGVNAFSHNAIQTLTLSSGLTYIPNYAFEFNNLTSLYIPDSIVAIDDGAFQYNPNLRFYSGGNNVGAIKLNAFKGGMLTGVNIPSVTEIHAFAFSENCLDRRFIDTTSQSNLDTYYNLWETEQKLCPFVTYNPATLTSGDVVGTVEFWGDQAKVGDVNTENSIVITHTFTANGTNTYSLTNNTTYLKYTTLTGEVTWIDKTAPTGTVAYSPSTLTSGNVVATLTPSETLTVTNNGGATTYTFTGNSSFTFEYKDAAGNTGSTTATVDWIDKTAPTGTVAYSPSTLTSGNVVATLTPSETLTVTNNGGATTYTFTGNSSFTFEYKDAAGNIGSTTATVDWIDKTAPTGTVSYSPSTLTSGNVVATLTPSETVTVTNNGGALTYTFTGNSSFTFTYKDAAGNTGSTTATVTWIDKTAPTGTVSYSPSTLTSGNVVATLTPSETVTVTNNGGALTYTFTGNSSFTFTYKDAAGNTGSTTATVDWIDKTAPTGTVAYSPSTLTSGNVVATLTPSETVTVTNNGGALTYTFTGNGSFTFEYKDAAGNIGSTTATVDWIDKTVPVVTLSGSATVTIVQSGTYVESGATWTDNVDGTGLVVAPSSGTVNTTMVGTYLLEYWYVNTLGNTGNTVTRTVTVTAPVVTPPSGSAGGGGGGGRVPPTPPTPPTPTTTGSTTGVIIPEPIEPTNPILGDVEQVSAYEWALSKGITTLYPIGTARLMSPLTRGELAKMLSKYAVEVLNETPDTTKECNYIDYNTTSAELAGYMKTVCQLEIMGLKGDGITPLEAFNPNDTVTRAQLVTTISRMLYGNTYDNNNIERWAGHMKKLHTDSVITVTDPAIIELRGWVMLMLYRLQ